MAINTAQLETFQPTFREGGAAPGEAAVAETSPLDRAIAIALSGPIPEALEEIRTIHQSLWEDILARRAAMRHEAASAVSSPEEQDGYVRQHPDYEIYTRRIESLDSLSRLESFLTRYGRIGKSAQEAVRDFWGHELQDETSKKAEVQNNRQDADSKAESSHPERQAVTVKDAKMALGLGSVSLDAATGARAQVPPHETRIWRGANKPLPEAHNRNRVQNEHNGTFLSDNDLQWIVPQYDKSKVNHSEFMDGVILGLEDCQSAEEALEYLNELYEQAIYGKAPSMATWQEQKAATSDSHLPPECIVEWKERLDRESRSRGIPLARHGEYGAYRAKLHDLDKVWALARRINTIKEVPRALAEYFIDEEARWGADMKAVSPTQDGFVTMRRLWGSRRYVAYSARGFKEMARMLPEAAKLALGSDESAMAVTQRARAQYEERIKDKESVIIDTLKGESPNFVIRGAHRTQEGVRAAESCTTILKRGKTAVTFGINQTGGMS
jgi:predicted DNA-binding WGR domain protein